MMRTIAVFLVALSLAVRAAAPVPLTVTDAKPDAPFDFVIVVSVDGLLPGVTLAAGPKVLPHMARLDGGSTTYNARTDPDYTITLPNHTCMITGRAVSGPDGHGWIDNTDPPKGMTIQAHADHDVQSLFNVAHEHGVKTGLFYGKTKFSLWVTSYNTAGQVDDPVITRASMCKTIEGVTDGAIAALHDWDRGLVFLHYATTDLVGHAKGWDPTEGSPYMQAVADIDAQLGRLFDAIDKDDAHQGRIAIILTADHGGGTPRTTHIDPAQISNYTIPFVVWLGDDAPRADLYDLNASTRRNPGLSQIPSAPWGDAEAEHTQPIRNGDAANLALSLLGLPPVPGSTINARQNLHVARAKVVADHAQK